MYRESNTSDPRQASEAEVEDRSKEYQDTLNELRQIFKLLLEQDPPASREQIQRLRSLMQAAEDGVRLSRKKQHVQGFECMLEAANKYNEDAN